MKNSKISCTRLFMLMLTYPLVLSCNSEKRDQEIKADLVSKAKEDLNFVGVMFTVSDARVHLWGSCPTAHSRNLVREKIGTIHVIKSVNDQIRINAVKVDHNLELKQKADSVSVEYPGVAVSVCDEVVTLTGKVRPDKLKVLIASIGQLNPRAIRNQLYQTSNRDQ
ncbi:osmotically-inducible protein OsmY [Pedobacter sp. W3I1]|uniref:BON domain-containing protein n=1 Tax=Pedobacter sp. W3I1 TaxID=3042291 RepID=UPI002787DDFB|nr:BON domain-containing protein [Pedobacter sp. W3I1]MDQ0638477.1 osmotically-inducible protein OsmY [Pedobacter sp. W3I1]